MNDYACLLTIGDFTSLKTLHEQWTLQDHDLAPVLRAKLEAATVVFPDDLPRDVASLGARIAYAVGEETQVAILTGTIRIDRGWLPITLPVGLALLGQREGWAKNFDVEPGRSRLLTLGRVLEQSESSWPGRFTPASTSVETPMLRLVGGSATAQAARTQRASSDEDDPGPTAA